MRACRTIRRARIRPASALVFAFATLATAPAWADDAACVAASEQALSLRESGHLHDALKQLAVCADAACPGEVKDECARRIEAIGAAMPTLVLGATDGAGNDRSAVTVTMDGAPLVDTLDGRPIAIDPGPHTFRFEVAGQPPVEKLLVLREGEKDRRESVVVGPVPPPAPAPAPPVSPPPAVSAPPLAVSAPPPAPKPSPWTTQRVLAVSAGAVGVVGLGIGAVFTGFAASAHSKEQRDCANAQCGPGAYLQSVEDYDTAKKNATGATVGFVAGGALVAAGIVLWLTAPPPRSPDAPAAFFFAVS
jgi:hypothetical protein